MSRSSEQAVPAAVPTADPGGATAKPGRRRLRRILFWTLVVFEILGIASAIEAIMSTRTAPGAIAWSVGLVAAPVVAVPAYWVFGRSKFEGYLEAREQVQSEFDHLYEEVWSNMDAAAFRFDTPNPAFEALRGLSSTRLVGGNRAELLVDGEATFDSIIEGIGRAEDYVLVQFYIVHDDDLGRRLRGVWPVGSGVAGRRIERMSSATLTGGAV